MLEKEVALFGGLAQVLTERGIGPYVCLVGGVLGLVAVGIVFADVTSRSDENADAPSGLDLGDVNEPR